jgi:type I restriction enzyme R subunit
LLTAAGWDVQDLKSANIHGGRGVALREFKLEEGFGSADYLLYIDAKAAGVIEAKKAGATLTGVEPQSSRYSKGLPESLPAWRRPLPFLYESTGLETHFTNGLDPEPRARQVFAFHRPDCLAQWLSVPQPEAAQVPYAIVQDASTAEALGTSLYRVPRMPELVEHGLWPAQTVAIRNLEKSLAAARSSRWPRAAARRSRRSPSSTG